jgi:hypothetical protein
LADVSLGVSEPVRHSPRGLGQSLRGPMKGLQGVRRSERSLASPRRRRPTLMARLRPAALPCRVPRRIRSRAPPRQRCQRGARSSSAVRTRSSAALSSGSGLRLLTFGRTSARRADPPVTSRLRRSGSLLAAQQRHPEEQHSREDDEGEGRAVASGFDGRFRCRVRVRRPSGTPGCLPVGSARPWDRRRPSVSAAWSVRNNRRSRTAPRRDRSLRTV